MVGERNIVREYYELAIVMRVVLIRLIQALRVAHHCSIGLRSGEYGGRNKSLQSAWANRVCILGDLWKLALSQITTMPGFSLGMSSC